MQHRGTEPSCFIEYGLASRTAAANEGGNVSE